MYINVCDYINIHIFILYCHTLYRMPIDLELQSVDLKRDVPRLRLNL